MRDQQVIEQELATTRNDLEDALATLKGVVLDKVDVKAKAHRAWERGRQRAHNGIERAEHEVAKVVNRAASAARERPGVVVGGIGGLAALVAGAVVVARRRRARAQLEASDVVERAVSSARERPALVAAALVGGLAVLVAAVVLVRKRRTPRVTTQVVRPIANEETIYGEQIQR
jgi:hypothetical protein